MTAQLYNELQQIENKVKDCEKSLENLSKKKVIINAKCDTSFGEDVFICTDTNDWNIIDAIPMNLTEGGIWCVESPIVNIPNEYKLIIKNKNTGEVRWEDFEGNREIELSEQNGDNYVINIQFNNK